MLRNRSLTTAIEVLLCDDLLVRNIAFFRLRVAVTVAQSQRPLSAWAA